MSESGVMRHSHLRDLVYVFAWILTISRRPHAGVDLDVKVGLKEARPVDRQPEVGNLNGYLGWVSSRIKRED